jgi:nitrite reductase (NO-forming)
MLTRTLLGHLALTALLGLALNACADDSAARPVSPPESATVVAVSGNTLAFEGFELAFKPAQVQVARPGRYVVTFTNTGHTEHDWSAGGVRLVARPGETVRGEVEVPASGLEFVCSIPGHAPAGMRGTITVAAAAGMLP